MSIGDNEPSQPINPYALSNEPTIGAAEEERSPDQQPTISEPRLWTVVVTFLVAVIAMIGASVFTVVIMLVPTIIENGGNVDPDSLTSSITSPTAIFIQAIPAQLAILLVAVAAAYFSPVETRKRLGLVNSGLTTMQWLIVGLSSFAVAAFGLALAQGLAYFIPGDESAAMIFSEMPAPLIVPWILFIAFLPGFGEEILYRGYMQRRLIERWSPAPAILVSSLLFAVSHIMPHTVLFAFPLGVWFGYLAWKTGSIWPTILGHALVNGIWNILNISYSQLEYSTTIYAVASATLCVIGIVCFWLTFRILADQTNADAPSATGLQHVGLPTDA